MYQSDSAPWLEFFAWNTDGTAKTNLVYNTSGISIVVVRDNLANSSALTLSAASGPTDWAAGKFWAMGGNKYRVGIATASISSFTGQISVEGSYTGGVLTGVTREVSAYNPAGNPNTIAPATPTNVSDVQTAILAKLPSALISGRIDATVGAYQTGLTPLQPLVAGRQIAVSATTGKVTAEAVELDSATQTQITNIENAAGYTLAVLAGTCADPQTASETYAITVFGSTFTVDMAGQDSTGTRTAPTLTKT